MKHLFQILVCCLCMGMWTACETKKEQQAASQANNSADSLQHIITQKEIELNDMVTTLNEIQEGFRKINEVQGRISLQRQQEGKPSKAALLENIKVIQNTMRLNNDLIENLRKQIKEMKNNTGRLRNTMESTIALLTAQLEEHQRQVEELHKQLADKDVQIAQQGEEISNLKTNISTLNTENDSKARTVVAQDRELHTAYYVFGTKRELKSQNILRNGEVLRETNFNKDYFTKIDIRVEKVIRLYSKNATLNTPHPTGTYTLDKDENQQYTLRITDPQRFWSISKYLVITVK